MNIRNYISLSFLLICLLAACDMGSQRRFDREALEQEKRRREPRRIKEGEIVTAAKAQGQLIAELLQKNSQENKGDACCPTVSPALLDSLTNQYEARIKCYPLTQPATGASALEQELLEAYRYNLEQQLPLQSNIQKEGQDYFLYTAPTTNGDSTRNTCGIWSIQFTRKQVVLGM